MNEALGLLETTGWTPAMVALDAMEKAAPVRVVQAELNDFLGVCLKIAGSVAAVEAAMAAGEQMARRLHGHPVVDIIQRLDDRARPTVLSAVEYNPLIEQQVVTVPQDETTASARNSPDGGGPPMALGFIETQGFTAVFDAIDTACKAANVEVVGKEKLGGGYVTVVIQGDVAAVQAAIAAGTARVDGLGTLIASHVIARPSASVLALLPR